jgi:predicted amino acid dehydrogenase
MAGLKEVCDILRKQDSYAFLRHLTINAESRNKRSEPQDYRDFYKDIKANQVEPDVKVAFVNHLISADWLWQVDPAMEGMPEAEAKLLVERLGFDWRVAPFPPMRVTSKLGVTADFTLYPLSVTSEEISYMLANNELTHIRNAVSDRAQAAQKDGCKVAGFGMFTSVVTNNCKSVRATDIGLTSGNALTVGMTKLAVIEEVKKQNIQLSKVAVIGSAGNIGSIYAAVISDQCEQLLLIGSGRMGSLKRLKKAAIKVYNEVWEAVVQGQNMGLASVLLRNQTCQAWLTHPQDLPDSVGEALFELFEGQDIAPILLGDDIEAVYDSPLIVCATNASETILEVEKIRENAIICDVSIPHNLSDDDLATRPDLTCIRGGVVSTPHNESLDGRARAYLDQGQVYACMAESIILGLEGEYDHYSYGDLSKSNVDRILALAEKHGFSLAGSKNRGSM